MFLGDVAFVKKARKKGMTKKEGRKVRKIDKRKASKKLMEEGKKERNQARTPQREKWVETESGRH